MTYPTPPGGIDRRASQSIWAEYARSLTPVSQKLGDSFTECPNRDYLVNIIEKQIAMSKERGVPVCLALVELMQMETMPISYSDAALTAVTKIFRSHLRPTDVIVRYRRKTLGVMLIESDEKGGRNVCARLQKAISRRLFFGKESITVVPVFGLSDDLSKPGNTAESLLTLAEKDLERARKAIESSK